MNRCSISKHGMIVLSWLGGSRLNVDSVTVSGFGGYEPLQHSIAWGSCPQLGGFEAACGWW